MGYGPGADPVPCAIDPRSAGEVVHRVSGADRVPDAGRIRTQQAAVRLVVAIARRATELLVRVDR